MCKNPWPFFQLEVKSFRCSLVLRNENITFFLFANRYCNIWILCVTTAMITSSFHRYCNTLSCGEKVCYQCSELWGWLLLRLLKHQSPALILLRAWLTWTIWFHKPNRTGLHWYTEQRPTYPMAFSAALRDHSRRTFLVLAFLLFA